MSIEVALADLASKLKEFPWGYLLTVDDQQRAHLLAVPAKLSEGVFHVDAGPGTRANVEDRPDVTLVFPPDDGTKFSLVVDGTAHEEDDRLIVTPTHAVMHRPALR